MFHLVIRKDNTDSAKTVRALSYRIGISLLLFISLYIAMATGMIKPEGIGARINMLKQQQHIENKTP